MEVSKRSLLYFASCEIDDALDNLFNLSLRVGFHEELKSRIDQARTLLEVASDLLDRIELNDE